MSRLSLSRRGIRLVGNCLLSLGENSLSRPLSVMNMKRRQQTVVDRMSAKRSRLLREECLVEPSSMSVIQAYKAVLP